MSAAALRYAPRPDPEPGRHDRIVALAHRHRRYGAGMIYLKPRQEGRRVNHNRGAAGHAAVARTQAALRGGGWSMTLAGLANAGSGRLRRLPLPTSQPWPDSTRQCRSRWDTAGGLFFACRSEHTTAS
jgi:hypothetical protein